MDVIKATFDYYIKDLLAATWVGPSRALEGSTSPKSSDWAEHKFGSVGQCKAVAFPNVLSESKDFLCSIKKFNLGDLY